MADIATNLNKEGEVQTPPEGEKTPVTYTEDQVKDLLQRETDRRVTDALKKQEQSFKAKLTESEKLSQMNAEQKQVYEYEQKVKALEAREKEFNLMSNKVEAQKILSSRELPVEFADYILAEDADTMMANIKVFEKQFKAAVNDAVSKKIASPAPKTGTSTSQVGLTKEKFRKMSIPEQSNLFRTNPALYKEMTQL